MNLNRIAVPANGLKPAGVEREVAANLVMDRLRQISGRLEDDTSRLISRLEAVSRPQSPSERADKSSDEAAMPTFFHSLNQIVIRLCLLSDAICDQIDRLEV